MSLFLEARTVNADLLILLSDIDGLYTADPRKNPELWAKALDALAERNRRMAKRMA